jgi:hypothetical protein
VLLQPYKEISLTVKNNYGRIYYISKVVNLRNGRNSLETIATTDNANEVIKQAVMKCFKLVGGE